MSKRYFLSILAVFVLSINFCIAQSEDMIKKEINDVKKKTSVYLYGEATASTQEEARALAEEFLYDEIKNWASEQKNLKDAEKFFINNKRDYITVLSTTRGNMYRGFVYVRKSDILKSANSDIIDNNKNETKSNENETESSVYPDIVKEIARITTFQALDSRLKEALANGEISNYARDSFPEAAEKYYFVIYNKSGNIIALISPGQSRLNVTTGEADSLSNYKGNTAVGFMVK